MKKVIVLLLGIALLVPAVCFAQYGYGRRGLGGDFERSSTFGLFAPSYLQIEGAKLENGIDGKAQAAHIQAGANIPASNPKGGRR